MVPSKHHAVFRWTTLGVSVSQVVMGVFIWTDFNAQIPGYQLVEKAKWISVQAGSWGSFRSFYWVGVDGLSLPLMLLSVFIMGLAILAAWNVTKQVKGFFVLMLVLNAAILGTFASLDALLFFVFFEFMLIPMYFLIGIWGGPKREYAAVKFFIYTLLGSVFILMAFIVLYVSVQVPTGQGMQHTFSIIELGKKVNIISGSWLDSATMPYFLGWSSRAWIFGLLALGFLIKLPSVPFHTWLPDAHVEAPTAVSMVLAGLLLKVGGYGFIRFAVGIFPDEAAYFSTWLGVLAVISILYGALNALAAKDLKRLVAYSSVSHMGFVVLGVAAGTPEAMAGSVYQMVSHGVISAMLFFIAGILYDRTNDRTITNYSGLYKVVPVFTGFVMVGFFAAMGIPGFSAFIGEVLVFLGAIASQNTHGHLPIWIPLLAVAGIMLTAGYFIWALQRMFFGVLNVAGNQQLTDVTLREKIVLAMLASTTLLLGVWPQPLLNLVNGFAFGLVDSFNPF